MKRRINQVINLIQKKKIDILIVLIYIVTFLTIYTLLTKDNHLFASTIDFKQQHYLIPEYFRTLFYKTHDLFPDFAFNLGGGQNIYYLSYYGLLNPIILISYLFPKIQMIDYIIITSCLIVLISTILFFFYLKKNHYNTKTSFIISFLFLCSGPLIFHAKRHIMFINYFPFLIMGLYGTDNYINKKDGTLLTISIALIILTSYYFSISALIVLFIYLIYKYHQKNKLDIKSLLKMSIPFILGIMISTILILPTAYTLLNGRNTTTIKINLLKLITPSTLSATLYSPYSIGLTSISIISLIYHTIKSTKKTKILSIICLLITTFPIFNYLLNGTLYINSKSLIPFIPIILILVAEFLNPYLNKKTNKKQIILITYLLISSFSICLYTNKQDKLMTKKELNSIYYNTTTELINEITKEDPDFYRIKNLVFKNKEINKVTNIKEYKSTIYSSTYNNNYKILYNDILNNPQSSRNKFMLTSQNNLLSEILLNEKYIITTNPIESNLELIKEKNNIKVYKNNYTLPLGYATNKLMNKETFTNLTYPNNVIALLNNIIIDDNDIKNNYQKNLANQKLDYQIVDSKNLTIIDNEQNSTIIANKLATMTIKINQNVKDKIIFIRFHTNQTTAQDLTITINNITNTLTNKSWKYFNDNTTFDYCLYGTDTLKISFKEGIYQLDNFEAYLLNNQEIKNINQNIDEFKIDKTKTKGDSIIGTINIKNDNSYFTISIPYDKGFKILIDKKEVKYEKTGANFIAFKINKGYHTINITYTAPLKNIAIIISISGIILMLIYNYYQKKVHPKI